MNNENTNYEVTTDTSLSPTSQFHRRSQSSLVAWVLGLSFMSIGSLGAFAVDRAEANPDDQNSSYIQNVELLSTPAIINLTLENTSEDKHIGAINIQPTTNFVSLDLDGHVQCSADLFKDQGSDPVGAGWKFPPHAFAFWGTVHLDETSVIPTEALHVASYDPTWYRWVGIWRGFGKPGVSWLNFAGNSDPFLVPLASIRDGSEFIRYRPVEKFLEIVDGWVQATGGSRVNYLREDHYFTVMRPISLSGYCTSEHTGLTGGGYETRMMPIQVKYNGDPDLIPDPPPNPLDDKAVAFQVTSVSVSETWQDAEYVGSCPTTLDFRIRFNTTGDGQIKYRLIDKFGAKGPIASLWVSGGYQEIGFGFSVAAKQVVPLEENHGVIDDKVTVLHPDKQNNSWRVEIVSPNSMTSEENFYYWTCTFEPQIDGAPDGYSAEVPEPEVPFVIDGLSGS